MAGQPSSCLFRAARSSCRSSLSRNLIQRPNSKLAPSYPANRLKTFSTSAALNEVQAAPEINFQIIEPSPARIVPASPSYFSGVPRYTDDFLALQNLYYKYIRLPTTLGADVQRRAWIRLGTYRNQVGEPVQNSKFQRILHLLKRLNRIHPKLMPTEVKRAIKKYVRPADPYAVKPAPQTLDEDGKSKGIGRRKSSSAKIFLVEGEGEVLINGKNILQAFPRLHDRESALWPLKVTERVDKYNVWALVSGGGLTGQAEAITLGLAKALMVHEPHLKPILRRAGCVTRNPKRVERKKHGHVKARKMPTWVKR